MMLLIFSAAARVPTHASSVACRGSAGVFMAVAMATEMGFLGLSFSLSLVGRPKWQVPDSA
jgi:hypothetical protein